MSDEEKSPDRKQLESLIDRELAELMRVLEKGDALVPKVLRFHLLTEYQLERILIGELPRGDRLSDDQSISYYHKLQIVSALDAVPDEAIACLKKLNSLRNRCSHRRDTGISVSDIESVGQPLGKAYAKLRAQHGDDVERLALSTFAAIYSKLISRTVWIDFQASHE